MVSASIPVAQVVAQVAPAITVPVAIEHPMNAVTTLAAMTAYVKDAVDQHILMIFAAKP